MKKYVLGAALAAITLASTWAGGAQAQTLRVGHILAENHPNHVALTEMAEELRAKSDGRLGLDVFANGILGTHLDLIGQVSSGAVDMAMIPGISPFQGLDPRLGVEEIPFLFASREEAYAAIDGPFGEEVTKILANHGLHALSYWENGFRNFTNNVRPIETMEDLAGIRFRSDTSKMRLAMFAEFGVPAVSMAFAELFTGLQQGVVDGQENPLSIIESANFYEVQKYLSLSGHLWGAAVLIINPGVYEKLSDDDKALLTEAAATFRARNRELIEQGDQDLVAKLREQGMEVNEVDKSTFAEAAGRVRDMYVEANGSELLDLIEAGK